jgi:pimeloyl-ACP methyl ester carboxylesterase
MKKRVAIAGGVAVGALASGIVGRAVLRRKHPDLEAAEPLAELPPEDLGPVVSFDGTELAVRAAGDPSEPPLVFVHGFSLDMTTWYYQWTALSSRFRCVLFDLRSHGRSRRAVSGDLSLSAMGHDICSVVEAVVPDGAILVGHSLGGMAILAAAESRPELFGTKIVGAVFAGSAASDLVRGSMGSVMQALRPRTTSIRRIAARADDLRHHVITGPADVGRAIARLTQFGPHASPHLVDHIIGLAGRAPREVWTDGLASLMDMDLRHALRHVTVPALVIVGDHDRVTPPASAVALAAELPDGRLEVIEGAGHVLMLERHDAFNEKLAGFAAAVFGDREGGRARQEDGGSRHDRKRPRTRRRNDGRSERRERT